MSYCRECGTELADESRFCPRCGRSQAGSAADPYRGPSCPADTNPARYDRPNNYLVLGIIATVLCCVPLGLVSVIYGAKVDILWDAGKYEEAAIKSRKARNWAIWTLCLMPVIYLIYIAVLFMIFGLESAFGLFDSYYM